MFRHRAIGPAERGHDAAATVLSWNQSRCPVTDHAHPTEALMEQSNITDLKNWASQLSEELGWGAATISDEGDWGFLAAQDVEVLIEPDPEMDTRHITFTAFLGQADALTPVGRLLGLLTINGLRPDNAQPVLAYHPTRRQIILVVHHASTDTDDWHFDAFKSRLLEFVDVAQAMAANLPNIDLNVQPQVDAAGGASVVPNFA
jgi:hypothetical protein